MSQHEAKDMRGTFHPYHRCEETAPCVLNTALEPECLVSELALLLHDLEKILNSL